MPSEDGLNPMPTILHNTSSPTSSAVPTSTWSPTNAPRRPRRRPGATGEPCRRRVRSRGPGGDRQKRLRHPAKACRWGTFRLPVQRVHATSLYPAMRAGMRSDARRLASVSIPGRRRDGVCASRDRITSSHRPGAACLQRSALSPITSARNDAHSPHSFASFGPFLSDSGPPFRRRATRSGIEIAWTTNRECTGVCSHEICRDARRSSTRGRCRLLDRTRPAAPESVLSELRHSTSTTTTRIKRLSR